MERNVYLSMAETERVVEAAKAALDRDTLVRREFVASHLAAGRVTAAPVFARCSSPTFHSAAMDGFAVKAAATFAAREGAPVRLRKGLECYPVNTGNPLPEGMDAVLMIEFVLSQTEEEITLEKPVFPWQHVRRIGEDIVATELLIPQNQTLTAYDVGALLSAGIWELEVWEQIRMRVLPTGDEVLDFRLRPEPKAGEVIESNSQVLAALARSWGCLAETLPVTPDNPDKLAAALEAGLKSDAHIVIIGAGSSAGTKDYTRAVIERFGVILAHGIAVMPGKPSIVALAQGKLVIGAPGYPVSAVVCFEELVAPLAAWLERKLAPSRQRVPVTLARKIPSKPGMKEIVRLAVGRVGEHYVATPLDRGAGMITSLTRAQAIAAIPAQVEGLEQGKELMASLLVPEAAIENTLVIIGSHDNCLDLLANELMGLDIPIRLASSHVGSMGGLSALRSGAALAAGAHLFDPDTGDFNFPYIAKYLPDTPVDVINLCIRHQGLIVPKGNPKGIKGIEDLARPDVRFINRQRGAGTRILLDHHLKVAGVAANQVQGYDKEEFTHMAVAVNVLSGAADCGLGVYAAAKALDLDFAPLARERYDLLVVKDCKDPKIEALLDIVRSPAFQDKIAALGGYETSLSGQVMTPGLGLGQ
jgi:putative molybdopterin biosynthesis protein